MNPIQKLKNQINDIEEKIGFHFKDDNLLILSFVHRSFINENECITEHNERLEFLGDAVLGLIMADILFDERAKFSEEKLSHLRASLVNAVSCAMFLKKLKLEKYILLGKGEEKSLGRGRDTIFADTFEAILGAIFLDGGLIESKKFILRYFQEDIYQAISSPLYNYKANLQDYAQKKFKKPPIYKVIKEEGPCHAKIFFVSVIVGKNELGKGQGHSKKDAEQEAAKNAINRISKQNLS